MIGRVVGCKTTSASARNTFLLDGWPAEYGQRERSPISGLHETNCGKAHAVTRLQLNRQMAGLLSDETARPRSVAH